jgi:hypothetical protein
MRWRWESDELGDSSSVVNRMTCCGARCVYEGLCSSVCGWCSERDCVAL